VESGAAPASSSLDVHPDGTIGLYMTFTPCPPRRQDKRSAGKRQSDVIAAGHKDNCSAGKRQSGVIAAGQSQSLSSSAGSPQLYSDSIPSKIAGSDQLSPAMASPRTISAGSRPHSVPGINSAGKPQSTRGEPRAAHSKSRCPSQRRRSARRRAAWRQTLQAASEVPQKHVSPIIQDPEQSLSVISEVSFSPIGVVTDVPQKHPFESSCDFDSTTDVVSPPSDPPDVTPVAMSAVDPVNDSVDVVSPHAPAIRERVPTYEESDSVPGVYFRSVDESDSDDDIDLPLSDPRHPGHLAHQWYQDFLAKQALE